MVSRLYKTILCAIFAFIAGMVAAFVILILRSPSMLSHMDWLLSYSFVTLWYIIPPLIVLCIIMLLGHTPSTVVSVFISVCWLTIIFAWWVKKPWIYYGEFPWWGFQRHYLGLLPIHLSLGLMFSICSRSAIGRLT